MEEMMGTIASRDGYNKARTRPINKHETECRANVSNKQRTNGTARAKVRAAAIITIAIAIAVINSKRLQPQS